MKAAHIAAREGLTGLEFASGIPGTLGGALLSERWYAFSTAHLSVLGPLPQGSLVIFHKTPASYGTPAFSHSYVHGTLGGALVMNAGAYGGEMKDVVKKALVLKEDGEQIWLSGDELALGYRTSSIARNHYIVLEVVLELKQGDKKAIESRMQELKETRTGYKTHVSSSISVPYLSILYIRVPKYSS